ncbi:MAG: hypothetical protein HY046_07200 [Acidobacteria bacterium]|nr:hypothetical protein [Acidobacteriota bacterium]
MRFLAGALVLAALSLLPFPCAAGTLNTSVIGLFPKNVGEFAYADLKTARRQKWFAQMKDQMLPSKFREFEKFLASAGMDPNSQVEELAWAIMPGTSETSEQLVGVALGQFHPASLEAFFKAQKLPTEKSHGYTLFAFGSGTGPTDIFFMFLDSNTSAFGHRKVLERLLEVRFGAEESLLRSDSFAKLVDEVNGHGTVWAVLDQGYTRLAFQQLIPEMAQFPEAVKLVNRMKALTIRVDADRGLDTRFQAVCENTEDANLFSALLQAGLLYRRYTEKESNPELAKALEDVTVNPSGDRLEVRVGVTEDLLASLLRRNTFAVKM